MRKAFFKTAVLFLCLSLTQCSDQGDPVVKDVVPPVDTAGVSKLVDTAYMLLKDTQVTAAMGYMKKAFQVYVKGGQKSTGQQILRTFTLASSQYKQIPPVIQLISDAIDCISDSTQTDTVAGKLFGLKGYFLHRQGQFSETKICYEEALKRLPVEQFKHYHIITYDNICQNYCDLGDYKKSEEYAYHGLRLIDSSVFDFPATTIIEAKRKALRNLGWALYEQNKNDEAIPVFQRAYSISHDVDKSDIQTFISKCHLSAHRYDSAFATAYTAYDLACRFPKDDDKSAAVDALHQIARCYFVTKNYPEALDYFYKELPLAKVAYPIAHHDCYKILVYIGNIYQQCLKYDKALAAYGEAIRMSLPDSLPVSVKKNPGAEHLSGEYWLMLAQEGKTQIYYNRAKISQKSDLIETALANIDLFLAIKDKRLDVFETDTSKNDIQGSTLHWYERGIELSLLAKDTLRAATCLQSAKAQMLRKHLNQSMVLNTIPNNLIAQYYENKSQKVSIESALKRNEPASRQKLLDLQLKMDQQESAMRTISEKFAQKIIPEHTFSIDSLQQHLPRQTAVLDFYFGDSSIYILAINPKNSTMFICNHPGKIRESVNVLLESLDINAFSNSSENFISSARFCFQNLLERPLNFIQQSDSTTNRLWIIADGPLHYLPFNTLLYRDALTWSGNNMPFLIKKYAIGYAFTAEQLIQKHTSDVGLKQYGGWGITYDSLTLSTIHYSSKAIAFNTRDFGPLPLAAQEIKTISGEINGAVWIDQNATKESFIQHAGEFRICHLAMHAIADAQSPQLTKLIFSANPASLPSNDHFLYATDIYGLNIPADLVVLSACNTASGEILRGEGVGSIGRAFQFAGARSVLMTQWSISDNSAASILPDFFDALQKGASKDIALQKAQLAMLERSPFQTPADWAGFIVSGDNNPIELEATSQNYVWVILLVVTLLLIAIFRKRQKR